MDERRCQHDLLEGQCAYCQEVPAGLTERVAVTAGGDVFHRSKNCASLREGHKKAQARGQEIHDPEVVLLARVRHDRAPCIACFPDFTPSGTRLCWVRFQGQWHKGLLTRWIGRNTSGHWEAWVAFVAEIAQLELVLDETHLRPREAGQQAPPGPASSPRTPEPKNRPAAESAHQEPPRVPRPRDDGRGGEPSAQERLWLDVPFAEKDEAKAAGARWDGAARRWYAPRPGIAALERWAAAPELPELLPGEDRSLGSGLFVDLFPSSCWFTNARSCLEPKDWERLRRMVTGRAGHVCEICGAEPDRAEQRWMEVHERWVYDTRARVQSLRRLICLCTPCHTVTHFGYARVRGLERQAFAHLMSVTRMSPSQAHAHVDEAFAVWEQRSQYVWSLDLSMLTEAGIRVLPAPEARDRVDTARRALEDER